jgi:hypothetical protein
MTVKRPVVAVAVLVAALSVLIASPALAVIATWTTPVDVSVSALTSAGPDVTVDSTGRAIAVWHRQSGLNEIVQSSTSVNGAAWSTPVNVSVLGNDAVYPRVTVDSTGRAIAVWRRTDGVNWIVQSSTSINGAAWTIPVNLSLGGQDAAVPQVTVDSTGRATAVWTRSNGSDNMIQSSWSVNGAAWSTAVDLSVATKSAYDPQVSVDSTGRAIAVWMRDNGVNYVVQSSTSLAGGAWSAPVDLSAAGQDVMSPQVSVDSTGRATAVWPRFNGIHYIIQSSTSLNGAAWSTPADLSVIGRSADYPQVTSDSTGLATAVWYRHNGSNNIIQSSTSLNGAAWSTPVDLSATLRNAENPQVTVDSTGLATAVWNRNDGSNTIIQSSTSLSGSTWTAPVDLSATGADANSQQVTVDSAGRATAVWQLTGAGSGVIQSSTIFSAPPAGAAKAALAATGTDATTLGLVAGGGALLVLTGLLVVIGSRRRRAQR